MKNSFVMYTDWKLMIEAMDNESRGELLLAIMQYQTGDEVTIDDQSALVAFSAMRPQFDKDEEKYEETMQKRSEAGKVAAQARKDKSTNRNESQRIVTNEQQSLHDNVNVDDNVLTPKGVSSKRFTPPTHDEVSEYCAEKGYAIDVDRFIDFYESKGWMVGKNKMKDWKASVRGWARSDREGQGKAAGNKFNNFENASYDVDDLEHKLLMAQEG